MPTLAPATREPLASRLTIAEEHALIAAAQNQDAAARDRLVAAYEWLTQGYARKFVGRRSWVPLEDACQAATAGLLEAIRRFDLGQPVRFSTFATYWIQAMIRDESRVWTRLIVPRWLHEQHLRHTPSRPLPPVPRVYQGDLDPIHHPLHHDPEDDAEERARTLANLADWLAQLTAKEQAVVRLYYGLDGAEPLKHREIAAQFGQTVQASSDAERRALAKLRTLAASA